MSFMEKTNVMKKFIIALCVIIFYSSATFGERVRITMRTSERPEMVRLVFESQEDVVKKAKVYHSYSLIKIEFPSEFELSGKTTGSVEISRKGTNLYINIASLKDIKVFNLEGPPRLVVDASVEKAVKEEPAPAEGAAGKLSELAGLTLAVDPGHGGYNIGLVGNDYKEKDIVLSISKSIRYAGKKAGAKVLLTRNSDKYTSLEERIRRSFRDGPGLFISMHLSSTPDFVVYYAKMEKREGSEGRYALGNRQAVHLRESGDFARITAGVLKEKFKRDVKIGRLPLPLLKAVDAPAILLELPDGKYFDYSDAGRYAIVSALLKGITEYERQ